VFKSLKRCRCWNRVQEGVRVERVVGVEEERRGGVYTVP